MGEYKERPKTFKAHRVDILPWPEWLQKRFDDLEIVQGGRGEFYIRSNDNGLTLIPKQCYLMLGPPDPHQFVAKLAWVGKEWFEEHYEEVI